MEEVILGYYGLFLFIIITLSIWESVWKAIALWKSAKKGDLVWFICLFIFNTAGILPILYIYLFSEKKENSRQQESKKVLNKKTNKKR